MKKALVWFRRDLRLEDNEALFACIAEGMEPIPVWLGLQDGSRTGSALKVGLHYSLIDLSERLKEFGLSLICRRGNCLKSLISLIHESKASAVYWNRRYSASEINCDKNIMESLKLQGIEVKSFASQLLVEPMFLKNQSNQPYKVFTPFYKAILGKNIPSPKPNPLHGKKFQPVNLRSLSVHDFNLLPSIPWHEQFFTVTNFTRADALNKIASLKQHKLEDYHGKRDLPAHDGTSLLSWALRLGVIGVKELWHTLEPDSHSPVYLRQLVWREFSWHLLFHFPKTATGPLNERFIAWPYQQNEHWLKCWQQGKTGVPIVDAGMRQLWKTGYMHNRVRMICASYLTKNLNMSWVDGEKWFYDTLTDADEANNVMGWQWVAGCGADAAPYFRIFNPVLQSMKFDPDGAYLLKWVPELAGLKGKALHQPWLQPDFKYPKPLVCLDTSRKMALQLYQKG